MLGIQNRAKEQICDLLSCIEDTVYKEFIWEMFLHHVASEVCLNSTRIIKNSSKGSNTK